MMGLIVNIINKGLFMLERIITLIYFRVFYKHAWIWLRENSATPFCSTCFVLIIGHLSHHSGIKRVELSVSVWSKINWQATAVVAVVIPILIAIIRNSQQIVMIDSYAGPWYMQTRSVDENRTYRVATEMYSSFRKIHKWILCQKRTFVLKPTVYEYALSIS